MWDWPGWLPVRCSDRGPVAGNPNVGKCQLCGQAPLRFVHQFTHPDFVPEIGGNAWIEVGGHRCANRLCPDYDWKGEEDWVAKRKDRREKWERSHPCKSIIGDHYLLGDYC